MGALGVVWCHHGCQGLAWLWPGIISSSTEDRCKGSSTPPLKGGTIYGCGTLANVVITDRRGSRSDFQRRTLLNMLSISLSLSVSLSLSLKVLVQRCQVAVTLNSVRGYWILPDLLLLSLLQRQVKMCLSERADCLAPLLRFLGSSATHTHTPSVPTIRWGFLSEKIKSPTYRDSFPFG